MNKLLATTLLATTLALASNAAAGADGTVRENRAIDARVSKVVLGGVVRLDLRQGPPSLVVSGDSRYVAKIRTTQNGDTLTIDMDNNSRINNPNGELRAEMSVPNLKEFVSQGVGRSEVSGFRGERLVLALDGAGAVNFSGQYRDVDARLGGVGGLTLNPGQAERVELHLGGAGHITVAGQTRVLRAHLGGVGGLDAQQLHADTVDLDLSGMGGASVYARTTANVSLNGMGSATVYGKPATRSATTSGFGKVRWQ
ncbi:GIN domain-containing protein [uncultured Massilia sp.]|uniref:GIN domain-containing protein n=1 Tax=uncultured Massilia sp. TaxID=169973 RepID=UPI0025E9CA87|nr:DUF2807 domain-containing protein [uncultured Massilia sp.]